MSQNNTNVPNPELLNKLWIDVPNETTTKNFIGKQEWTFKLPEDFFESSIHADDVQVVILRNMAFFYKDQKTNLGALRKIYTEKAVNSLLHDGYVEIIKLKEENN